MDGLEVLNQLKAFQADQPDQPEDGLSGTPVIVLSSNLEELSDDCWCSYVPKDLQDTFYAAGAAHLVRKTTFAAKEIVQLVVQTMVSQAGSCEDTTAPEGIYVEEAAPTLMSVEEA